MDRDHRGAHHHQPRHGDVRVPDVDGAQGDGTHAAPLRPEPCRPVRVAAADRRPDQADPQGGVRAVERDPDPVHRGADRRHVHRARRVRGDSVRPRLDDQRLARERRGRERADRAAPDLRVRLDRRLRLHGRRLGVGVEVLDPRLDAHLRAARVVRGVARAQRARRRDPRPVALARRHRAPPGRVPAVRGAAVRRHGDLLHRGHRRDEPRAVRPARGGHRARRRLPHRVLRHALGRLPDVGVHQPDHALGPDGDALLRRLARAVGPRARSGSS